MKTTRILITLLLATFFMIAGVDAQTVVGKFIRKTGQYTLDDKGSTLTITEVSPAKWSLKIVWRVSPELSLNEEPDALRSAGWFVYVESPDRFWIYDGDQHLIFEGHENQNGVEKIVSGMSREISAACPKEVSAALPEKGRGKKQPD